MLLHEKVRYKCKLLFIFAFTINIMERADILDGVLTHEDYKTLKEIGFTDNAARYIVESYVLPPPNHQDLEYWITWYTEFFFLEKLKRELHQYGHNTHKRSLDYN